MIAAAKAFSSYLTSQQISLYHDQGYLILNDFNQERDCKALMDHMKDLLEAMTAQDHFRGIFSTKTQAHARDRYFLESARGIGYFLEEDALNEHGELTVPILSAINKVGHGLHDMDTVFQAFSYQQRLKLILEDLGYAQPQWVQSMYIFKQPRIGGAVDFHQDGTFLYSEPKPPIGFWFALETATEENGCLWVLPGGHRQPLRQRFRRVGESLSFETYNPRAWVESDFIPVPVRQGSLVIFDGHLPHGSYPNRSPHSRHAYTLHAVDQSSHYCEDNWLQPTPERPFKNW